MQIQSSGYPRKNRSKLSPMEIPFDNHYTLDAIANRTGVPHKCIIGSAKRHKLPISLMYAVLAVEGGKPGLEVKNSSTDNTVDYGPAQINSWWLNNSHRIPALKMANITVKSLKYDACNNIEVAAIIMADNIEKSDDLWVGIGRYNSWNDSNNFAYRVKIYKAIKKISASNKQLFAQN